MAKELLADFPNWAEEVAGTVTVHSQFILHGNIRDRFLVPPRASRLPQPVIQVLWEALRPWGYECLIVSDQVDGIRVYPDDPRDPHTPQARQAALAVLRRGYLGRKATLERLRNVMARVSGVNEPPPIDAESAQQSAPQGAEQTDDSGQGAIEPTDPTSAAGPRRRVALVLDFASRLVRGREIEQEELAFFLFSQKLAMNTPHVISGGPVDRPIPVYNPVIWLTDGERDLPVWFAAGTERIRQVAVPLPSRDDRRAAAALFASRVTPSPAPADVTAFADLTDRMTLHAMDEVTWIAKDRGISLASIRDAVRIYRLGVEDNPWRKSSIRHAILNGEKEIPTKVFGQHAAVLRTLDILKRASLGLSGAHAVSTGTRPKGVLFFAGPTGVGKTELAKQVAKAVFGDQDAYLRFDMSEFSQSHSADRLTGAPPGYVGYEAGGQLTSALRRNPFQVILFDEIEKAHPQVMDKFLQILEDGRLTDGQGTTTHFSECVIIFTSNLGIIDTKTRLPLVERGIPYPDLEKTVLQEIKKHFAFTILRPELMNRIGDNNVVVFDFINAEVAKEILSFQIANVLERVKREQQVEVALEPAATAYLQNEVTRAEALDFGGRGIGSTVENRFTNPLARFLFDEDCQPGARVVVESISVQEGMATLKASAQR